MDDLISRKWLMECVNEGWIKFDTEKDKNTYIHLVRDIVPSAQPKRKTGKWVHGREIAREMVGDAVVAIFYESWQCSECKCIVEEEREPLWNFCPNCGADMRGESE